MASSLLALLDGPSLTGAYEFTAKPGRTTEMQVRGTLFLRRKVEMLGIAPLFGGRIHGGTGDPARFSKRDVFRRLLHTEGASDRPWLSFGDGPVEIADTKALGGIAIGVCSDERQNGSGRTDAFKRRQLLDAGADAVMPDYRDAAALMDYLLGR